MTKQFEVKYVISLQQLNGTVKPLADMMRMLRDTTFLNDHPLTAHLSVLEDIWLTEVVTEDQLMVLHERLSGTFSCIRGEFSRHIEGSPEAHLGFMVYIRRIDPEEIIGGATLLAVWTVPGKPEELRFGFHLRSHGVGMAEGHAVPAEFLRPMNKGRDLADLAIGFFLGQEIEDGPPPTTVQMDLVAILDTDYEYPTIRLFDKDIYEVQIRLELEFGGEGSVEIDSMLFIKTPDFKVIEPIQLKYLLSTQLFENPYQLEVYEGIIRDRSISAFRISIATIVDWQGKTIYSTDVADEEAE